jgi:hypothetical protein
VGVRCVPFLAPRHPAVDLFHRAPHTTTVRVWYSPVKPRGEDRAQTRSSARAATSTASVRAGRGG